ncbi:hypothetical protein QWY87_13595 [Lutimonas halocynthiae]|uniref:hypothetical protein n=1 Tax=Lutimonas halocynthiae TaxID=1446477 RepID=UPI0025B51E6F|nr:hypothetical protein [Lutimonas halocynthiae]MDN3643745.1 hypothetical protein [Lutimonas halocynthiae]
MLSIKALQFDGSSKLVNYYTAPHECPFCHNSVTPKTFQAFLKGNALEIVYGCPNSNCGRIFLAQFNRGTSGASFAYQSSSIGTFVEVEFSDTLKNLSSNFIEIFNQASKAESLNLHHIAGIGFRKALEFLIKDYLIAKNPEKEINIKKKFLGKCIKDDIENINVREMGERATWLGNDETHYVRKWEDKDIKDLKLLIKVTTHWIEMELLTEQYKKDMI